MPNRNVPNPSDVNIGEEVEDVLLRTPDSYVISVRLNRAEGRLLSDVARQRGLKLSTFLREAAKAEATRMVNISQSFKVGSGKFISMIGDWEQSAPYIDVEVHGVAQPTSSGTSVA